MTTLDERLAAAPPPSAVQRIGQFVFRFRDYLVPVVLVGMLALTEAQAPWGSERANLWLDLVGLLTALAGQVLRVSVIGYAYIQRGGANKRLAAPRLVTEGFYAHSRNPMYVGNFLLVTGLLIIYNSFWAYVAVLPLFCGAVLSIIHAEEVFLRGRFGAEYEAYCRRVNRFVPRLTGLRATLGSMHFNVRRVLRKEYGTTFAWLSGALFLMAWERLLRVGYSGAAREVTFIAAAFLPIVAAYATVRWMKKTGRLQSPD